jgi:hypothetical protein
MKKLQSPPYIKDRWSDNDRTKTVQHPEGEKLFASYNGLKTLTTNLRFFYRVTFLPFRYKERIPGIINDKQVYGIGPILYPRKNASHEKNAIRTLSFFCFNSDAGLQSEFKNI